MWFGSEFCHHIKKNKYMKTKNLILMSLLCCLLMIGCKGEDIFVDFNKEGDGKDFEFAGPFAKVNITVLEWIEEAFPNEEFDVDANGLISKGYTEEIFLEWDGLAEITDKSGEFIFPTIKTGGALEYPQKIQFNNTNDVRFDSLIITSGNLTYNVDAPVGTNGFITISIPELITANGPYTRTLNITASQRTFEISLPLNRSKIRFSHDDPNSSYITFNTSIDINPNNPVDTPGTARIAYTITDIIPEVAFGYFGQKEKSKIDASISFSLFKDMDLIDEIEFADVELDIMAYNLIGVPFSVRTENIRLFNDETPEEVDLLLIDNNNFVEMDVPTAQFANPIIAGTSNKIINNINSNFKTLGNKYPDRLLCDIRGFSNPDGEESQNFITTETRLRTDLKLKIPFWFKAALYTRKDTVEFDFNDMIGEDKEYIEKLEFAKIHFDFFNKFPIDIIANAVVVNENNVVIETLFGGDQNVIKSGVPNSIGRITKAEETEFVVSITNKQIKRFISENAKNIIIETKASSYNQGLDYVKIFDTTALDAIISTDLKGQMPDL